jgi:general secretion pathway protein L
MFASRFDIEAIAHRFAGTRPLRLRRGARSRRWDLRRASLGVEIRGSSLYLACVRPGWGRRWLVATGVIPDFAGLNGEQLGSRLREFLEPVGAEEPLLVLGLPRSEVIVRLLEVPRMAASSLPEVLNFQLNLYKPSDEEGFCWDAAVVPHGEHLAASLVLLPRVVVERLASQFVGAGCPVSRLTVGQFSLLHLIARARPAASTPRLLCLHFKGADVELVVTEERRLVYSRAFPLQERESSPEQIVLWEVRQAFATLRWNDGEPVSVLLAGSAPEPVASALAKLGELRRLGDWLETTEAGGGEAEEFWGAIALALDGLSWTGYHRLNLLPAELRPARRRWRHAPTYALLAANALLLVALGARAPLQEHLLLKQYRSEIARVEPTAAQVEQMLAQQKKLRQRLELLRGFEERGREPLEALGEIAQRLPAEAWLNLFTYRQGQVEIVGAAKSASAVLPLLDASPRLDEVKFVGALTRDAAEMERFRLQMRSRSR